ncbi:site-specific integrase [Maribacter hydrothermalis]|uniref:Integrase n=1 Tax=Maribacter hydrothermalis TaxID=1836467 RepID=A0A1B7Z053_9FLAO|nr:site-specific integrase [Maribacter hydrothermalis]APQ16218.1 integrase [Maribacter hydrothermalis]OBR36093.1 integrase [Maribacter hydrothermalis]
MQTSRTFSIHLWLNTSKGKDGLAPIYARVTVDGKRAEISLQRQTKIKNWDSKSKRTKARTPEAKALNIYLNQIYFKLLDCQKELLSECKLITAKSIKYRFVGKDEKHKTLLELVTYHNKSMLGKLKMGTLKNYYTTENYLKRFLILEKKTKDIYLKQISSSFIIDFEQHLRKGPSLQSSKPLRNNGVMKHLERLRKLMNLALDLEWLDKNPFVRYKLKFNKFTKQFLTQENLETFEVSLLKEKKYQIVRDLFVFACYTGLSYSDVKLLNKANIKPGIDGDFWIFIRRQKNEQLVKIPLLDKALAILKKYENYPNVDKGRALPVISNQKINFYLKEITSDIGINKNITFHSARHTFATTVTLSNGVPIETVSKLMGHKKISTTQIYARVLEEKISSDIILLKKRLEIN